jgi:aerobic-type carbon monoxide dehydrogenase small subunit (CoxS/CutS family)
MEGDKNGKRLITRRGFLKGAGASGLALGSISMGLDNALGDVKKEVGLKSPLTTKVSFTVNGVKRTVVVENGDTLADTLREKLYLTGIKVGCNRAECGACTVLLDGRPVNSCTLLAVQANGKKIETIEGLYRNGKLHPIQEAFIEFDAPQCGFCTSGQIMSVKGLLDKRPDASLEEIKVSTSGNLCRCGSYNHIFRAALSAGKKMANASKG